MKPPVKRNIYGQRLTQGNNIDLRQFNVPKRQNYGQAYARFHIAHKPGDKRPWHLFSMSLTTGETTRIGRYKTERIALYHKEEHAKTQPDRLPGAS